MPRPKPAIPVDVSFQARTTRGERNALTAILAKRTARLRAVEPAAPPVDLVAWLRTVIREQATAEGIAIEEPAPAPPAKPAKAKPKASKG